MIKYKGYEINGPLKKIYYKKKAKKLIAKQFICLDTETSHNHNDDAPQCWIYQWAFTFNNSIYYGRTPEQLIEKLKELIDFYKLSQDRKLYIFVHNLPYDFSYLAIYFYEAFGDPVNALASEAHKPFLISYECGLELRCTYKLSNDSLERWGKKLGIKHPKMAGAIDYNIIRHQDDPLYRDDWRYMFTDCIAMDESIKKQLALYNDDIASIPLTSTGYPRREIFRAYNGSGHHKNKNKDRQQFKDTALDVKTYLANEDDFSGGITHGNRFYKGKTIKGDIRHRDFRSHYPTQQHKKMPMGKFVPFTDRVSMEDLEQYAASYAILCHVYLEDVKLKPDITLPYMQTSHVMRKHAYGMRTLDDNGRIVAFKGQCEMWLDYNELKLIISQYDYAYILIKETYASVLDYLPPWMVKTIDKRFKGKTDRSKALKEAKHDHVPKDLILQLELDLMKDKNMLNGIYGVAATNPVRTDVSIQKDHWTTTPPGMDEIKDKLDDYYKSFNHCMRYQWGVYTTIAARLQLMEVYNIITTIGGPGAFIYCDTDSMFYLSTPEIEKALDDYNAACYQWAMDTGAYITADDGTIVNYNAFTDEGEKIKEFRFLHSKCYAYICEEEKDGIRSNLLKCVIAGVKAYDKESKTYREDELGSIDDLKAGKVFTKCGGTAAKYIETGEIKTTPYGDSWAGGCIISRTTKTLSDVNWAEVEHAFLVHME